MITGFTCGAFDLLHAGHVIFLKECRSHCDYLIVGLQTDPTIDRKNKNKPIQTIYERYSQLINCKWVDQVIPYDTENDLKNLIATTKMNIRFMDESYRALPITGEDICKQLNIDLFYTKRRHTFSSTELRERIYGIKESSISGS